MIITNAYFALFVIFAVKGREKFWKIKRGRERKSLGSPVLKQKGSVVISTAVKTS